MQPSKLFTEQLWHPGKTVQKYNDCVIHAFNMMVGGPLFTHREMWTRHYANRRKKSTNGCSEDIRLWGVSLQNLRWIIYDLTDDMWFSLRLQGTIDRHTITLYVTELKLTIHDLFDEVVDSTAFLQWVDFPRTFNKQNILSTIDCHAAVVRKVNEKWYLLDAAEDEAICITDDDVQAKNYFCYIDFINFYVLEEDNPPYDKAQSMVRKWLKTLTFDQALRPESKRRSTKTVGQRNRSQDLAHSHHTSQFYNSKRGYT